ncbi:MAG TPA: hypothetical protein VJ850_09590 [Candidatus Limnocylindrales bacterium]|nr:hypothetical protein [Candidatus Limnocylindrales bacterium]
MRNALLAGGLLAVSLAAPVGATDQVPFKGTLAGTAIVTPINPPIVQVTITATGNATQLGRFTLVAPHTVNQATLTAVGNYYLTAANGDTITATLEGTAQMIDPPNVIATSETGVITGGTGRFAGATGTFHVDRIFNRETGVTTGTFEGWISVPGA